MIFRIIIGAFVCLRLCAMDSDHPMQTRSMTMENAESSGHRKNISPEIEAAKAEYQHARDHIMVSTFMGGQPVTNFTEADKEKMFTHAHLLFEDSEQYNSNRMRTSLRNAVLSALSCSALNSFVAFVCISAVGISIKDTLLMGDPTSDVCVPYFTRAPMPLVNEACCCCLAGTVACTWCIKNSAEWCRACIGKKNAEYYKYEYEKVMQIRPDESKNR